MKFPSKMQIELWSLKRKQLTGKEISDLKKITLPAVSQALKEANERIQNILENTAKMNKINIEKISAEFGYLQGYSCIFKVKAYITFSLLNGIQVWYDHKGECESCGELGDCRAILKREFEERKLFLPPSHFAPTKLSEILFQKIEEMIN